METLTAAHDGDDGANIGFSILMQFSDARRELDLEIRKLITVFCHVFRHHKAPPTPLAYLHATCSSLDLIAAAKPLPSADVIHAHLTILSNVIPNVPTAFVVNNLKTVCNSIGPALRVAYKIHNDVAVCAGINCIAQLLTTATNGVNHWSHVSETFCLLLSYTNSSRITFRVREHARLCVRDTLQSFGATLLVPASKKIMDLLMNKYPILPNKSDSDGGISIKAEDTLDLLIVCIGVMPAEDTTTAFEFFKELLELHNTNVTTLITDALYKLCLDSALTTEVPLDLLLHLICSICVSVSQHKTNYTMETIAGLLKIGLPKIFSLNKRICQTKLPIVIDALIVLLQQSEVLMDITHAGNAFKCLVALIDESFIKQGVERTLMNASMDGSQSDPTLIEKLCATFHKLLSFPTVRHIVFEIISTMFDKLGEYSSYLMRVTVKTLADMQKLPDKTFHDKEEVKLLLEVVVEKCGLDAIAAVIPQEHMELLAEINQQRGSKSAVVSSRVFKATTSGDNLSQSKDTNNGYIYSDFAYKTMLNYKRKMAGKKSLSDCQWRKCLERQAKRRAEEAIGTGLEGATRMTKKLKL